MIPKNQAGVNRMFFATEVISIAEKQRKKQRKFHVFSLSLAVFDQFFSTSTAGNAIISVNKNTIRNA